MNKKIILILLLMIGLCTYASAIGLTTKPDGMQKETVEDTIKCTETTRCPEWIIDLKGNYVCEQLNLTKDCDEISKDGKSCDIYHDWEYIEGTTYICPATNITKGCKMMNGIECIYDKKMFSYIEMYPNEVKEHWVQVQNAEDKEYNIKLILQSDSNIIDPIEKVLTLLPNHENDPKIHFNITIPEDAVIGTEYNVLYSFSTNAGDGGMVNVDWGFPQEFKVKVIEKPKEPVKIYKIDYTNYIIGGAIGLVIIMIIGLILFRNKGKSEDYETEYDE